MALGGVFMTDTDGNIGYEQPNNADSVSGLLFDISAQSELWTKGAGVAMASSLKDTVVEINSVNDAVALGITPYTGLQDDSGVSKDFLHGIPYYHIKHYFDRVGGTGRLFVMFADCSSNFNALIDMQKASVGIINQFGVWTERKLWSKMDVSAKQYSINLIGDLNAVASELANKYYAPVSILLAANTAKVATASDDEIKISFSHIPSCITDSRYVSVVLGQELGKEVGKIQSLLDSKTPVGAIGAALGCTATAGVHESIGWVERFNLQAQFPDVEMGFGDATVSDNRIKSGTAYSALSADQLNTLDDKGYVLLVKYAGVEGGVFFSGDQTCSRGDYRKISLNRTINKSRRLVRAKLLPYVNSPIKVDPQSGQLSAAQITVFSNLVTDALNVMANNGEISGVASVTIPASQNILKNDRLVLSYKIVPIATSKTIDVTEGLTLKK